MVEVLSQAYGYGFALGLGGAFAVLMIMLTWVLTKFAGEIQNSEHFTTASRSVKSGLIASSTVSAWTWPATLLTSGAWAYDYGVAGPFMYGCIGTFQVVLFVFLAIEIKRKAPGCHTIAQLFFVRFGKLGHICFLCYCIATNILVSSLLLLGGSQAFSVTTGMHVIAASFLLPTGVCVYTLFGGLKATFISDWIHTVIIFFIICSASFRIYTTSDLIGSPGKMWELLMEVQEVFPSSTGTNYLNFKNQSLFFTCWSVGLGGLCSVFGDPGYSQRAIASDSKAVFAGYVMGGICWFIVPWALGSSAGLASRALLLNPNFVTYPNGLTDIEISSGMPVIYGLLAIFGKSGAAAGLIMIFMSVTSATSAELIAFSSIAIYDIYQNYIKPEASGKQLVKLAHFCVVFFSLLSAVLAVVFNYVGVTTGWIISFYGILLGPEASAIALALYWKKMSTNSIVIGSALGTLTGIACWIGAAYHFGGHLVNKDTLSLSEATFIGNIGSLFSAVFYIVLISLYKPANFDFSIFSSSFKAGDDALESEIAKMQISEEDKNTLRRQSTLSLVLNSIVLLGVSILLPLACYGSNYTFSKKYFTSWIVIMMIWLIFSTMYIIIFPLWQGRQVIFIGLQILFKAKQKDSVEVISSQEVSTSDDGKKIFYHEKVTSLEANA